MLGPCKRGPTSAVSQCLARTSAKELRSGQTSVTGMYRRATSQCGEVVHRRLEQQSWATRGGSQTTHQLSVREKLRSRESMCVEWMTCLGVTQVQSHWKDATCEGHILGVSYMHDT